MTITRIMLQDEKRLIYEKKSLLARKKLMLVYERGGWRLLGEKMSETGGEEGFNKKIKIFQ